MSQPAGEREVPTAATPEPSAPVATFDEAAFKLVMRRLAGTVTVFATASEDGLHGMTATAMCSVSAEPPTVLIVVNRAARTHPHIHRKQAFTINILAESQQREAQLFASKGDDQFAEVEHRRMSDGCPIIAGVAAYLHCAVESQHDVGTHTIFVGQVLDAGVTDARPLVYQDGRYGRVEE